MRKTNIASIVSVVTLFDIVMLFIDFVIACPSAPNADGYYNDNFDIPRFEGIKGSLFNWFSNMIEPVTEGFLESLGEYLRGGAFFCWIVVCGVFAASILSDEEWREKCPWIFILTQAVISIYWAVYNTFIWFTC